MARQITEKQRIALEKARAAKKAKPADDEALLRGTLAPTGDPSVLRQRLLAGIDPETAALFSDEELAAIEREEQEKAKAEARKAALAEIRATARHRARVEQDLISPATLRSDEEQRCLAELVTFRIDVPTEGSGHQGRVGIYINGRCYANGIHTEPRAIFETLQDINFRAIKNEFMFVTNNQEKPGRSAVQVLGRTLAPFEIKHAA